MRSIPVEVLEQAVADGVITAGQRDALLRAAQRPEPPSRPVPEAPRGLNAVMIAYTVGALLVLFAAGWFIRDRWQDLGPAGVLGVAIVFGGIFIVAARMLRSAGFVTAAGWTAALAVVMAPLATWAVLRIIGSWPEPGSLYSREPTLRAWNALTLELTTIAAALVAYRAISFPHLALEISAAAALTVPSLAIIMYGPDFGLQMTTWVLHFVGAALLAIGYATERNDQDREVAGWFYFMGLGCVAVGWASGWGGNEWTRHALPVVSFAALASAVLLNRRVFLTFGMLGVLAWLVYLAFDVFRDLASFPVILAAFGTVVILVTVLTQRRYPALVARIAEQRGDRQGTLPGDYFTALAPLAIAVVLLFAMAPAERENARRDAEQARRINREIQLRRQREMAPAQRPVPR